MIFDFATTEVTTIIKIVSSFTTKASVWNLRDTILRAFWKKEKISYGERLEDSSLLFRFGDVTLNVWVQDRCYLLSLSTTDDWYSILISLVDVMKKIKRRDFPIKIDKKDTITLKAAIAIAALAVAQGVSGRCAGILWDMARDKEI